MKHYSTAKSNVVLCHNPNVCDKDVWNGYQGWTLSSHTHGDQYKPPFLLPSILPEYYNHRLGPYRLLPIQVHHKPAPIGRRRHQAIRDSALRAAPTVASLLSFVRKRNSIKQYLSLSCVHHRTHQNLNSVYMKKIVFLILPLVLICTSIFAQKKQAKENSIYISSILNFDSEEFVVNWSRSFTFQGSPVIQGIEYILIVPRSKSNIGFSFQKISSSNIYREISLTRLSYSKRNNLFIRTSINSTNTSTQRNERNSTLWDIGTRFEFGKYFITDKNNKINIGAAFAAEPSFILSNATLFSTDPIFIKTERIRAQISFVPVVAYNITPNFALAIKFVPNIFNLEWNRTAEYDQDSIEKNITNEIETSFFKNNLVTNIIARYRIQSKK